MNLQCFIAKQHQKNQKVYHMIPVSPNHSPLAPSPSTVGLIMQLVFSFNDSVILAIIRFLLCLYAVLCDTVVHISLKLTSFQRISQEYILSKYPIFKVFVFFALVSKRTHSRWKCIPTWAQLYRGCFYTKTPPVSESYNGKSRRWT